MALVKLDDENSRGLFDRTDSIEPAAPKPVDPATEAAKPPAFSPVEYIGAAYTQSNIIISNAMDKSGWLYDQSTPGVQDPDYNPIDDVRGTKYEGRAALFLDSRSRWQTLNIMDDIDLEEGARKILDTLPWYARLGYEGSAAITDLPTLLPVGVITRGGGGVAAMAAKGGAAGLVGAGVSEWGLRSSQHLRTQMETNISLGASVLLSGLLGGVVGALPRSVARASEQAVERTMRGPDAGTASAGIRQSRLDMELDRVRSGEEISVTQVPEEVTVPPNEFTDSAPDVTPARADDTVVLGQGESVTLSPTSEKPFTPVDRSPIDDDSNIPYGNAPDAPAGPAALDDSLPDWATAPAGERPAGDLQVEPGAEGLDQTLVPGVKPITEADRLAAAADRPMSGGDSAPGGMFDEAQTNQPDMFSAPAAPSRAAEAAPSPSGSRAVPGEDAIAKTAPTPDKPAGVFMLDATKLEVDAERFQFKSDGNAEGVNPKLKGVTEWDAAKANQAIVYQQEDGRLFVVDGHQRTGLARRLGEANGERIEVPSLVYREGDGWTAEEVMILASEKNIAEGSGSIVDAAKIIRARPEVGQRIAGISDHKIGQARDLSNLGENAWRSVLNDVITPEQGAVIGRLTTDPKVQDAAVDAIVRFEPKNLDEAAALTRKVVGSGIARADAGRQGSLFDDDPATSTVIEEIRLTARAAKELRKDASLFGRVLDDADRIESKGVSSIDRTAAANQVDEAGRVAAYLQSQADTAGPIRDALLELAQKIKSQEVKYPDASKQLIDAVKRHVDDLEAQKIKIANSEETFDEILASNDDWNLFAGSGQASDAGAAGLRQASREDLTVAGRSTENLEKRLAKMGPNDPRRPGLENAIRRRAEGSGTAANRMAEKTKWLNPNLRLNFSPSAAARRIGQMLGENSLYQSMHNSGESLGPAAETLIRGRFRARLAAGTKAHEAVYKEMVTAMGARAPSRLEFERAVAFAMRRGDVDPTNEFVTKAAQEWRSKLLDPLKKEAQATKDADGKFLLDPGVTTTTAQSYLTRIWNRQQLIADEAKFRNIAGNWLRDVLQREFDMELDAHAMQIAEIEGRLADVNGSATRAVDRVSELQDRLTTLDAENPRLLEGLNKYWDANRTLREARAAATRAEAYADRKAAEALVEQAQKNLDDTFDAYGGKDAIMSFGRDRRKIVEALKTNRSHVREGDALRDMQQVIEDLGLTREQRTEVLDGIQRALDDLEASDPGAAAAAKEIARMGRDLTEAKKAGDQAGVDRLSARIADMKAAGGDSLANLRRGRARLLERRNRIANDEVGAAAKRRETEMEILATRDAQLAKVRAIGNKVSELRNGIRSAEGRSLSERKKFGSETRKALAAARKEIDDLQRAELEDSARLDLEEFDVASLARQERLQELNDTIEQLQRIPEERFSNLSAADAARIDKLYSDIETYVAGARRSVENQGRKIERLTQRAADEKLNPASNAQRQAAAIAERDARIAERAAGVADEVKALQKSMDDLEEAFNEKWYAGRDADDGFRQYVDDAVTDVFNKLTGKSAPGQVPDNIIGVTKGPLKERTFNIPDEMIEDFLDNNIKSIATQYAKKMAGEIELTKKFGRATMKDQIDEIVEEFTVLRRRVIAAPSDDVARSIALYQPGANSRFDAWKAKLEAKRAGVTGSQVLTERQKIALYLDGMEKSAIRDIEGIRDLIRGDYAKGANSSAWGSISRQIAAFNYLRMLGGVVTASIPDIYRPIMVHGFGNYMSGGLGPLLRNRAAFNASVAEAKLAGQVVDGVLMSRLSTLAEIDDPMVAQMGAERFLQNATNFASRWNGIVFWTDAQKAITSVLTQNRIIKGLKGEGDTRFLAYLGIGDDMRARIKEQVETHGEVRDGVEIANTEKWVDDEAVRIYQAAMNKDIDSIIVTKSVGDVPLFANTPTGKLLLQFKSFMMASHSRVLLRGLQEDRARFVTGMMAMTAMGMLVTYLRAAATNRLDKLTTNPGWWIGEGVDASGILSLPMEFANTMEKTFGTNPLKDPIRNAGDAMFGGGNAGSLRFENRDKIGTFAGPTGALITDVAQAAGAPLGWLGGDDPNKAQTNAAMRLVPFYSYPGMRQIIEYGVKPLINGE